MFIAIITLIISLYIAGIAGWFSVVGLMSIFSGYALSAMYMGIGIEAGKIIGVSWLYRNWKTAPFRLKYFTLGCTLVAMILTSGGIFGYLAKAHLEQNAPLGTISADIKILDYKISREQKRIDNSTVVLDQLDTTVNALIKNEKISSKNGARDVRESQKQERETLNKEIEQARKTIDSLTEEKVVKETTLKSAEMDVGPIKYISKVISNGDTEENVEDAVTKVIFLILLAFDPFAIALLMCANYSFMKWSEDRNTKRKIPSLKEMIDACDQKAPLPDCWGDNETPLLNPESVEEAVDETEELESVDQEDDTQSFEEVEKTQEDKIAIEEPVKAGLDSDYVPIYAEDGKQARLQALMDKLKRGEIGWLNMKTNNKNS